MVLGELYYYNKVLDQLSFPLDSSRVSSVELLGLSSLNPKDYEGQTSSEITSDIRDKFSAGYEAFLKNLNLKFANQFWSYLTSPVYSDNFELKPNSEFQSQLITWAKDGFAIDKIPEIIKIGELTSEVEDFCLFYALKVLYKFTQIQTIEDLVEKESKQKHSDSGEISPDSEILVLTENYLAPLFVNINCTYIPLIKDTKLAERNILEEMSKNSKIKMVIIEGSELDFLTHYLQIHLPNSVLVTNLDLNNINSGNQTFFDKLVKETLGVRLT